MSHISELTLRKLDGSLLPYTDLDDKVLLIVNVASECGLTPQYAGLVKLYNANKDKGLVVIGVPCNQFGAQEPGSASDIQAFCQTNFQVSFPLLEKQDVNGSTRSELYKCLVDSDIGGGLDIEWNFAKFLVDARTGQVLKYFNPRVNPVNMVSDIEQYLAEM